MLRFVKRLSCAESAVRVRSVILLRGTDFLTFRRKLHLIGVGHVFGAEFSCQCFIENVYTVVYEGDGSIVFFSYSLCLVLVLGSCRPRGMS